MALFRAALPFDGGGSDQNNLMAPGLSSNVKVVKVVKVSQPYLPTSNLILKFFLLDRRGRNLHNLHNLHTAMCASFGASRHTLARWRVPKWLILTDTVLSGVWMS